MKFSDIPGHYEVKDRLRQMVDSGRIPHAILLEGPSGAAKYALARAFAQYIHCTNRHDGDSCGCCPACRQEEEFNNISTFFTYPVVKKSGRTSISDDYRDKFKDFIKDHPWMDFDQWRAELDNVNAQPMIYVEEASELLRRLGFMSRTDALKVVLLWMPERLKEEATNKLLKLVEEPSADTVFIMTSNSGRDILPTIYSRTQSISVKPYTDEEIAEYLVSKGVDKTLACQTSPLAQGNLNTALKLVGSEAGASRFLDLFVRLMRSAYSRKVGDLRAWSLDVAELGRETEIHFLEYCSRMVGQSFLRHLAVNDLLAINAPEAQFISKFFPFINHRNVEDLSQLFDEAARDISRNANSKIVLFDLAVRVIILIRR